MGLAFFIFIVFSIGMFTAAFKDAMTMTIPNWVSLLILGSFFLVVPFVWQGWAVFGEHLLVGFGVFLLGFILFAMGGLGGGDAKLMAATAFWWQTSDLILYTMYTTLSGGVIAFIILFGRKFLPARVLTAPWAYKLIKDEKNMPYGLALAFGALATLPQSEIFKIAAGMS